MDSCEDGFTSGIYPTMCPMGAAIDVRFDLTPELSCMSLS